MANPIAFSGRRRRVQIEASPPGEREERIALMQNSSSGRASSASATRRETTNASRWLIALSSSGRGRFKSKIIYSIWDRGWAHPAGWQPVIAYITRNDKRRCAATIWKVGHPMGLPLSLSCPGVIKAFQDIVRGAFGVRSTGKFVRSGADKCTSSVLSLGDRRRDVSTVGNKFATKRVREKDGPTRTISLSPVRHPHPRFLPRCRACSKLFA